MTVQLYTATKFLLQAVYELFETHPSPSQTRPSTSRTRPLSINLHIFALLNQTYAFLVFKEVKYLSFSSALEVQKQYLKSMEYLATFFLEHLAELSN